MHQLFFKQDIGANQSQFQDSSPLLLPLQATLTKRELKVKRPLLMPKNQKISLMPELIWPMLDFHMHLLSFKLMLRSILDTGAKRFLFQDSSLQPLLL
jgi:hypothetical protein